MAVSVNGLTKKTDTEVTASDITTSDVALISDKVDKLVDQIQKALKFNNNSEKDKKELNATLKDILKQQEQIQDYQETREKLLKRSKNLTKEQREAILEDLDKEVLKIFKNFSSLDGELSNVSLAMSTKLGVGKNFNKTYKEILDVSHNIQKTAERRLELEKESNEVTKEALDSQKSLEKAREKALKEQEDAQKAIGKGIGSFIGNTTQTMLYNALGPLRIFTDPMGGKSKLFSAGSTLLTALGGRVNSTTESELKSKGGTIGKTGVYIGKKIDELSDKSSNDEDDNGFLDNVTEGVSTGIVSALTGGALSGMSFSGLATTIASGLTTALPWVIGIESLAVLGGGIWEGISGNWKETLESVTLKVKDLTKGDIDTDNSGTISGSEVTTAVDKTLGEDYAETWNPFNWIFHPVKTAKTIGASIGEGIEEEGVWGGIKGFFTSLFQYGEMQREFENQVMMEYAPDVARTNDDIGILYRLLGQSGRIREFERLKYNYYNNQELADKYLGGLPDSTRVLGMDFYDPEGASRRISYLENNPSAFAQELQGLSQKYGEYLNDAIIYKDNSVYVPHPDDNIVLTKDEVSTPVLSGNFEGTLLDILRTIATNTKGSGNVYAINSTPEFDFSMLRV